MLHYVQMQAHIASDCSGMTSNCMLHGNLHKRCTGTTSISTALHALSRGKGGSAPEGVNPDIMHCQSGPAGLGQHLSQCPAALQ